MSPDWSDGQSIDVKGRLVRSRALLVLQQEEEDWLGFGLLDEEANNVDLVLSRDRWRDFGEPDEFTITIEPGNQLG